MKDLKLRWAFVLLLLPISGCVNLSNTNLQQVKNFDLAAIYLTNGELAQFEIYPIGNNFNPQNKQISDLSRLSGKFETNGFIIDFNRKSRSAKSEFSIFSDRPQLASTVDKTSLNLNLATAAQTNLSQTKCSIRNTETSIGGFGTGNGSANLACETKSPVNEGSANFYVETATNENLNAPILKIGRLNHNAQEIEIESLHDYPILSSRSPSGYRFKQGNNTIALVDISTQNRVFISKNIDPELKKVLLSTGLSLALFWEN